jgi:hypothetical protein
VVGTAALRLSRRPDRLRLQVGLLDTRAVELVVCDAGGRRDYLDTVIELADRECGITAGAALAASRRADPR